MNPEQDLISLPGSCEGSTGEIFSVESQPVQTDAIITVEKTECVVYLSRHSRKLSAVFLCEGPVLCRAGNLHRPGFHPQSGTESLQQRSARTPAKRDPSDLIIEFSTKQT